MSPPSAQEELACIGARLIVIAQCRHAVLNELLWRCIDRRQQQLLKEVLALRAASRAAIPSSESTRKAAIECASRRWGMCNSRCTRCQASGIRCCPANGTVANNTAPSMRSHALMGCACRTGMSVNVRGGVRDTRPPPVVHGRPTLTLRVLRRCSRATFPPRARRRSAYRRTRDLSWRASTYRPTRQGVVERFRGWIRLHPET